MYLSGSPRPDSIPCLPSLVFSTHFSPPHLGTASLFTSLTQDSLPPLNLTLTPITWIWSWCSPVRWAVLGQRQVGPRQHLAGAHGNPSSLLESAGVLHPELRRTISLWLTFHKLPWGSTRTQWINFSLEDQILNMIGLWALRSLCYILNLVFCSSKVTTDNG